jgi:hypothetical protein
MRTLNVVLIALFLIGKASSTYAMEWNGPGLSREAEKKDTAELYEKFLHAVEEGDCKRAQELINQGVVVPLFEKKDNLFLIEKALTASIDEKRKKEMMNLLCDNRAHLYDPQIGRIVWMCVEKNVTFSKAFQDYLCGLFHVKNSREKIKKKYQKSRVSLDEIKPWKEYSKIDVDELSLYDEIIDEEMKKREEMRDKLAQVEGENSDCEDNSFSFDSEVEEEKEEDDDERNL